MKEQIIRDFINEFPIPCSYHRILLDAHGDPYDFEYIGVNSAFEDLFQTKLSDINLVTFRDFKLVDSRQIDIWVKECWKVLANNNTYDEILYNVIPGMWILANVVPLSESHFLIMYTDIKGHALNRMHIDDLFAANLELMCLSNLKGEFLKVNDEFEHVLGYSKEELEGKSYLPFIHNEDIDSTLEALKEENNQKPIKHFTNRYRCKDGTYRIIEWKSQPLGEIVYSTGRDITESRRMHEQINQKNKQLLRLAAKLKETNEKLKSLATTDQLTGLYNRHFFDQRIIHEMEQSDRLDKPLSMLIYDIDYFKHVNDDFGHPVGDEVLKYNSSILYQFTRPVDYAFRLGGEEFALLMPDTTLEMAETVAENIRMSFANNIHPVAGKVTASFGVAQRIKGESFANWYDRIDKALYIAKSKGRNQVISYRKHALPIASVQIDWNTDWNSGNEIIDSGHKELLELAIRVYDCHFSKIPFETVILLIDNLIDHVKKHFTEEELLLKEIGYENYTEHKEIHGNLFKKIKRLKKNYLNGTIKASVFFSFILDEVIMEHLVKEDIKFFPVLSTNRKKKNIAN